MGQSKRRQLLDPNYGKPKYPPCQVGQVNYDDENKPFVMCIIEYEKELILWMFTSEISIGTTTKSFHYRVVHPGIPRDKVDEIIKYHTRQGVTSTCAALLEAEMIDHKRYYAEVDFLDDEEVRFLSGDLSCSIESEIDGKAKQLISFFALGWRTTKEMFVSANKTIEEMIEADDLNFEDYRLFNDIRFGANPNFRTRQSWGIMARDVKDSEIYLEQSNVFPVTYLEQWNETTE